LGPEIYGVFSYALSWYLAFLSATYLGLNSIMAREVGRDRARGTAVVSRTLSVRILVTLGTAAVCAVTGWFFEQAPEIRSLLILFAVALVGRSLALWANGVFTAYEVSRYAFRQDTLFRILEVSAGITVLLLGGGVFEVVAVHTVTWWLQALSSLTLVGRRLCPLRLNWSREVMFGLLVQALPIGLLTISENWLLQGPVVLLRHNGAGEHTLGQLALALQAFFVVGNVAWAVGMSGLPVLSRTVARGDGKDRVFARGVLRMGLLFGGLMGLAGMALGPPLVDLVLGSRYAQAGTLLGPALWLLIPLVWGTSLWPVLFAHGRVWPAAAWAAVGALVMSTSLPAFVSGNGALGALLAAGTGMTVWAVGLVVVLAKDGELSLGHTVVRPALAVLGALACYLALEPMSVWVAFIASVGVLSVATVALGVVSRQEWLSMRELAAKWR